MYSKLSIQRSVAAECLYTLLTKYRGAQLSELDLCDEWRAQVKRCGCTFDTGWYTPPPNGFAALVADDAQPARVCFDSLRSHEFWPSNRSIDWERGFLYVYCSPVDRLTGEIADFTAFHYFGKCDRINRHIEECRSAHSEILSCIRPSMTSREFHHSASLIIEAHGLYIEGHSITDPGRVNLGHTLTRLPPERLESLVSQLNNDDVLQLSNSRRFINRIDSWSLREAKLFTVEPRLRSIIDPKLPQVSLHTIVQVDDTGVVLQDDIRSVNPFENE